MSVKWSDNTNYSDDSLVSATAISNSMTGDHFADYLKIHGTGTPSKLQDNLMNEGITFEAEVVKDIEQRGFNIVSISETYSTEAVRKTADAILDGTEIIHSGSLFNVTNRTYGIADLIVRSDVINRLFKRNVIPEDMMYIRAPLLPKGSNYHYVIIDIKFTTLMMLSDGVSLSNSKRFKAYKGQVYIYNEALYCIQGYSSPWAFIVGSGYKFKDVKGKGYEKSIATVSFDNKDKDIPEMVYYSIDWVRIVRINKDRWKDRDPSECHPLLKPNMNINSGMYHKEKYNHAEKMKDITLVWQCGPKQREKARLNGITRYDDARLTAQMMGFTGSRKESVDAILKINRDSTGMLWSPPVLETDMFNWTNLNNRFYVDFEANQLSGVPVKLFMIGVLHETSSGWVYKSFIADDSTVGELFRIMVEFKEYIYSNVGYKETPRIYHYGNYEPTMWKAQCRVIADYYDTKIESNVVCDTLVKSITINEGCWVDILLVLRDQRFTVKGAMGFSIKDIGKSLFKHGLIKSCWAVDDLCMNGEDAMVYAKEYYETSPIERTNEQEEIMVNITKYNEMDVLVMRDIVKFMDKLYV